jgi:hypothetical protein
MKPGEACIACHSTSREAPELTAAGTVYPTAHEPDDCYGASGAAVVLTGADGVTITLTVSAAGNFFTDQPLALPFTAKVQYQGRERAMVTRQHIADCNSCHTVEGATAAPGRIMLP